MSDRPQFHSLTAIRWEWVKMFYPDMPKGTPVGIVHAAVPLAGGPPTWVFDHRSVDTQATATSPMGIDIGTLRYLATLTADVAMVPPRPAVTEVHFLPQGAPTMYMAPLASFADVPYRTSMLSDGNLRTRVFLPFDRWTPMRPYADLRPAYWNVTWIKEDGTVLARHIPR